MKAGEREFESLLAAVLDGSADAFQRQRLQELLRSDVALRTEYAAQMRTHALLQWRTGRVAADDFKGKEPPVAARKAPRRLTWLAAAAALILGMLGWWTIRSRPAADPAAVRTVMLEVLEVSQTHAGTPFKLATGAKLALSELEMPPGLFRFRLESGAVVAVTGPADLRFIDPMRLRVVRGKVTADVGDHAKGFIVETAQTQVVDLGTRFGVDVADSGHTDVVVFEGEVELHDAHHETRQRPTVNRLIEGEAVRVNVSNQLSRITSVSSGPVGDDEWSTSGVPDAASIITAVHDNLHNPQSNFYYRILRGGMREDAQAFIAKRHEWNGLDAGGIPGWLEGADLVQTFGARRENAELQLTVTTAAPAMLYVFVDSRVLAPDWLRRQFTDTGARIALENAPLPESGIPIKKGPGNGKLAPFAVWKCLLPEAGSFTLGPPPEGPEDRPHWMYGIAAKRL